jgi:hypothetical protein
MPIKSQVESFYHFALSQVGSDGSELSMDELYCLWRMKNPIPEELTESVAAFRAAYAEMESGDTGRPARQALRESCQQLGLVIDE